MPEQNYAVATVPLTTPGDRWADGKLLGKCHRFLHWGYAEALSESSLAILCLWAGTEPTAGCGSGVCRFPKATGRLAARI